MTATVAQHDPRRRADHRRGQERVVRHCSTVAAGGPGPVSTVQRLKSSCIRVPVRHELVVQGDAPSFPTRALNILNTGARFGSVARGHPRVHDGRRPGGNDAPRAGVGRRSALARGLSFPARGQPPGAGLGRVRRRVGGVLGDIRAPVARRARLQPDPSPVTACAVRLGRDWSRWENGRIESPLVDTMTYQPTTPGTRRSRLGPGEAGPRGGPGRDVAQADVRARPRRWRASISARRSWIRSSTSGTTSGQTTMPNVRRRR